MRLRGSTMEAPLMAFIGTPLLHVGLYRPQMRLDRPQRRLHRPQGRLSVDMRSLPINNYESASNIVSLADKPIFDSLPLFI